MVLDYQEVDCKTDFSGVSGTVHVRDRAATKNKNGVYVPGRWEKHRISVPFDRLKRAA